MTGFVKQIGWLSHVYTMIIVIIAWVIFRSDNMNSALVYIGNMFGVGATGLWDSVVTDYLKATAFVLLTSCIGITPFVRRIFLKLQGTKAQFVETIWIILLFGLSLLQVVSSTYNPFIYFNF